MASDIVADAVESSDAGVANGRPKEKVDRAKGVKNTVRWFDALEPFAAARGRKWCKYPLAETIDKGALDHEKMEKCWPIVKKFKKCWQTRT